VASRVVVEGVYNYLVWHRRDETNNEYQDCVLVQMQILASRESTVRTEDSEEILNGILRIKDGDRKKLNV